MTNLDFGSDMEESKISGDKVMSDSCGLVLPMRPYSLVSLDIEEYPKGYPWRFQFAQEGTYQNIDLTAQNIFGFFKSIVRGSLRPSLDLIKTRRKVRWGFRLSTDRVEVGRSSVLALWKGNELVTSALDDGQRNEVARH